MRTGQTAIKNTGILLLGRILSIGLGIIYIAVLSRYIHAVGMGIIATATSFVSIASLLVNFGLNDLSVRDIAANKSHTAKYVTNIFFIRGVLAAFFVIIVVAATNITNYPQETIFIIYIYCFAYIFDLFTDISISVFTAHERMEYSAILQTGRDIINIGISLVVIALKANLFVIVGISVLASLIKLIASLGVLHWKFVRLTRNIDIGFSRRLLTTAMPFAALIAIDSASGRINTLILSLYWSAQEVGWYASAGMLTGFLLILPTVLLQALFPVFSKFNVSSRDSLKRAYSLSFKYLLLLGFASFFGAVVTADQVINLVFGPGFEKAAVALQILAVELFWMFGFANGYLLLSTGGQNLATKFSVFALIVKVTLSFMLTPRLGLVGTGLAHIAPGVLLFLPLTWICHNRLELRVPYMLGLKTFVAASLMAWAVPYVLQFEMHILIPVLIVAPLSYIIALIGFGVIGRDDFELVSKTIFRKE